MGRHQQVVIGIQPLLVQLLAVGLQLRLAQFLTQQLFVIQPRYGGEVRVVAVHSKPDDGEARAGFRCVGVVVESVEAQAAVVGDEAWVALDHRCLDGLVVGVGQLGAAQRALAVLEGGAVERAADFIQIHRQLVRRNAQRALEVDDEGQRIERLHLAIE